MFTRSQKWRKCQIHRYDGYDKVIIRDKWIGRGEGSGLEWGNKAVSGWLQDYAGGTIFVDELHRLDDFNQGFLLTVLDRIPMPVATGRGPDIIPSVRLIFATLEDPEELLKRKVLSIDFYRRLGRRYLTVPAMKDRKEDIPVFVQKYRQKLKPDMSFYLALLQYDWEVGNVDELLKAITHAFAKKKPDMRISASDLAGKLPQDLLKQVKQTPKDDALRAVLNLLVTVLKRRGYKTRSRKAPLSQRLAALFSVNESKMSRWLDTAGIRLS